MFKKQGWGLGKRGGPGKGVQYCLGSRLQTATALSGRLRLRERTDVHLSTGVLGQKANRLQR